MIALLATSTADRNLYARATVYSGTPDASNPRLCYALIMLGNGTKNVTGAGGDFEVTITIAGNTWNGGAETQLLGNAVRPCLQTTAFFVPANAAVTIAVKSPNSGDTDVAVTAYVIGTTLDASAVRTAVGLASGDLDTQLDAIAAKTNLINDRGETPTSATDNIELYVSSIKSKSHVVSGNLTGKTLKLYIESKPGAFFEEINATGANGSFSFTPSSTLVSSVRTFAASLREPSDGNNVLWNGFIEVTHAAKAAS